MPYSARFYHCLTGVFMLQPQSALSLPEAISRVWIMTKEQCVVRQDALPEWNKAEVSTTG